MDINVDFPGGLKVDAHFNGFNLCSDQPLEVGGENSAPSPYLIFLASIGWLCYAAAGVSGPHKKTGRESAGVSGCADFDYKRFVWHTNCC